MSDHAAWRRSCAAEGMAANRIMKDESTGVTRLTEIYRDGNRRLDEIAAGLTPEQAAVILGYLRAVTNAVHAAIEDLAAPEDHDMTTEPTADSR